MNKLLSYQDSDCSSTIEAQNYVSVLIDIIVISCYIPKLQPFYVKLLFVLFLHFFTIRMFFFSK